MGMTIGSEQIQAFVTSNASENSEFYERRSCL